MTVILGAPSRRILRQHPDCDDQCALLESCASNGMSLDRGAEPTLKMSGSSVIWMLPRHSIWVYGFEFFNRSDLSKTHIRIFCGQNGVDWHLTFDSTRHKNLFECDPPYHAASWAVQLSSSCYILYFWVLSIRQIKAPTSTHCFPKA